MKNLSLLLIGFLSVFSLHAQNVGIGTNSPKQTLHVNGDYYGEGHIYLYAHEGDSSSGTAYIQGRDDSGTSDIALRFRTQNAGSIVEAMQISENGRVGVGTTAPANVFQVDGVLGNFTAAGIRLENTTGPSGWSLYPASTGTLFIGKTTNLGSFDAISGAYTTISDTRLKTDIKPLENVLSNLVGLEMKRYKYIYNNPSNKEFIGLLAQDLQAKYPEFVSVNTTNEGNTELDNQLGVDYAGLSVLAIKAIQEQQEIINTLTARLEALERKLSDK